MLATAIGYAGGQIVFLIITSLIVVAMAVTFFKGGQPELWIPALFFAVCIWVLSNAFMLSGRSQAEEVEHDLKAQGFRVQSIDTDEQTVVVTSAQGKAVTLHYQDHAGQYRPYAKDYLTSDKLKDGSR